MTKALTSSARISATALAFTVLAIGACSKTAPNTGAGTGADAAASSAATAGAKPGNACERGLVTTADAADILGQPVATTKNIPGDAQTCEFTTAGFSSLSIALRPGHGKAALGMYTSGKMDAYDKSEPLSGVGDEAVRSLSLNRISARKNDLLCEITGPGMARESGDPMPQKLGALCNRIFAAY